MNAFTHSPHIITLAGTDFETSGPNSYTGWQATAPILALSAVALAGLAVAEKAALLHEPAIMMSLIAALALSAGLFFLSLFFGGDVTAAVFDTERQRLAIIKRNPFAHTVWHVAMTKVAEIKTVIHYDSRGRKQVTPEIRLVSGARVALPLDVNRLDLDAAREVVTRYRAIRFPEPARQRPIRRPGQRAA